MLSFSLILGKHKNIIQPRINKSIIEKQKRIKEKGEVFTPSWVCNHQNNLIDNVWFDEENVFNIEKEESWESSRRYQTRPGALVSKIFKNISGKEIEIFSNLFIFSTTLITFGFFVDIGFSLMIASKILFVFSKNICSPPHLLIIDIKTNSDDNHYI